MEQQQHSNDNVETPPRRAVPAPVPALQLADREQLMPRMTPASFSNWLSKAQRERGFPEPVRTGLRSCAWEVHAVMEWLASRPRKGVFAGRRRT
jgi:predicted DNA-binding transcriptional regulator AlpA